MNTNSRYTRCVLIFTENIAISPAPRALYELHPAASAPFKNAFTYRMLDLETALLEDCSAAAIYNICKGRSVPEGVRAEVWQACLDVQNKGNQMLLFNDIFDLPEQSVLRDDCHQFVANLGNEDEDKVSVVSDLESILTHYCKSNSVQYERGNGWVEIMLPLIALKLPRWHTYNLFEAIKHRYVPRSCKKNGPVFHLFRLLLLYHDPELCSFLDTMRISPDLYCLSWFQSLFAATCNLPAVLCMWDLYFQQADPFFVFFLALVIIVNARMQIFSMKGESKQVVVDMLAAMPCALEADDVTDFCSLAQYYALKTPCSFKEELQISMFSFLELLKCRDLGDGKNLSDVLFPCGDCLEHEAEARNLSQALCLPVSAHELVENTASPELMPEMLRFFLVDCRPAEQYNAGHLPTAFHLDCNLMLQEPAAFLTAVQGLLTAQRQALAARSAAGGEHLCFLGSGRLEEDQYTHMVVASFLQKHTHYVSMLTGGYMGHLLADRSPVCHPKLNAQLMTWPKLTTQAPGKTPFKRPRLHHHPGGLEDHSPQRCVVCVADAASEDSDSNKANHIGSSDIFGKLSDYYVLDASSTTCSIGILRNETTTSALSETTINHIYKASSIFKNKSQQTSTLDVSSTEVVQENQLLNERNCLIFLANQSVPLWISCFPHLCILALLHTHLILYRDVPLKISRLTILIVKTLLLTVVKVYARVRCCNTSNFKYNTTQVGQLHLRYATSSLMMTMMEVTLLPPASVSFISPVSNVVVKLHAIITTADERRC
ncbi:hypothetical protein PR048_001079 [Dryococelus australis]|uniref:TBC1 domain family member 23 n=1 Tax=Dryococelus australis TaxID=614101 RepID=A0ABQ9IGG0_9NEOP|nr:hypothetical protein PR048_001079 [Dryococelus australis]